MLVAALCLLPPINLPDVAVVRLRGGHLEVVAVGGGKERTIRSRALPFIVPGEDVREQSHNNTSMRKSMAVVVDRKSRAFFNLEVFSTVYGELVTDKGWESVGRLVKFDYSGGTLWSAPVRVPWEGEVFLGHDGRGNGLLVHLTEREKPRVWQKGSWSTVGEGGLPAGLQALLDARGRLLEMGSRLAASKEVLMWNTIP